MTAAQLEALEEAFDEFAEELGETITDDEIPCVPVSLEIAEQLEPGGHTAGKKIDVAVKKSDLPTAPEQESIVSFRSAQWRIRGIEQTAALYILTLIDPAD